MMCSCPPAPCYGCQRREVGCHGRCGEYAEFLKENDARREKMIRDREKRPRLPEREKAVVRAIRRRQKK